jgi:uncharacterized membrane protein YhaH (DUF805 family)
MELFFSPNGRIDQTAYWRAVWILCGISVAISVASIFVTPIIGLLSLGVMWAWIAVHAKRFHDNGKTGWYMLAIIVMAAIISYILGMILPGLFGFDQAAYQREVNSAMSGGGGFAEMMELMNESQRAMVLPNILSTVLMTAIIGVVMGQFKTDPGDNQYGAGPGGASSPDAFV